MTEAGSYRVIAPPWKSQHFIGSLGLMRVELFVYDVLVHGLIGPPMSRAAKAVSSNNRSTRNGGQLRIGAYG